MENAQMSKHFKFIKISLLLFVILCPTNQIGSNKIPAYKAFKGVIQGLLGLDLANSAINDTESNFISVGTVSIKKNVNRGIVTIDETVMSPENRRIFGGLTSAVLLRFSYKNLKSIQKALTK